MNFLLLIIFIVLLLSGFSISLKIRDNYVFNIKFDGLLTYFTKKFFG